MTREEYQALYGLWRGDDVDKASKLMQLAGEVYDLKNANQETVTDSFSVTSDDSGKTYNVGVDAKVITLPLITVAKLGMKFRFRNTGADGAVALTISPNAADGVNGTVANAAADSVASGVVNKDLVNTKATANNMDWIEIEAVAVTKWAITGGVGIWASEA